MSAYTRLRIMTMLTVLSSIGRVAGKTQCSNVALTATKVRQQFVSPNYPDHYSNNTNCQWILTATPTTRIVVLEVVDFNVEAHSTCSYDSVTVYDGSSRTSSTMHKLCGIVTDGLYLSTGAYMTVDFHSDGSNTDKGFVFTYYALDKSTESINRTTTADETVKFITSPNYPNNCPSNVVYTYYITSSIPTNVIKLETIMCNISYGDQVAIYDGNNTSSPLIAKFFENIPAKRNYISTGLSMTLHFIFKYSNVPKLFKFQYRSINQSDRCGTVSLNAASLENELVSPNYPSSFINEIDCQWHLTTSSNTHVIALFVKYLHLQYNNNCTDNLTIYDGNTTAFRVIEKLCRQEINHFFISSGGSMTVALNSDPYTPPNYGHRFRFTYLALDKSVKSLIFNKTADSNTMSITSPNFPRDFESNIDCTWYLTTSSLYVIQLTTVVFNVSSASTFCIDNYVAIYDGNSVSSHGLDLLCGKIEKPTTFTSSGPSMTIHFHSSNSMSPKMFFFNLKKTAPCPSQNHLSATKVTKYFTSPNYPGKYLDYTYCAWYISSGINDVVTLSIEELMLEGSEPNCTTDYLVVYEGPSTDSILIKRMCGTYSNVTTVKSNSSTITMIFKTDSSVTFKGFRIGYFSKEASLLNSSDDAACPSKMISATLMTKYFTSPNYPSPYFNNTDCVWHISAGIGDIISLSVENLTLEENEPFCRMDYLAFYDGPSTDSEEIKKLCGTYNNTTTIESNGSVITVKFHSDSSGTYNGFNISYFSKQAFSTNNHNDSSDSATCPSKMLSATSTTKYFTSPNYPSPYFNNTDCVWHIYAGIDDVIALSVENLTLEGSEPLCRKDYLTFYDGPSTDSEQIKIMCGTYSNTTTVESNGSVITVKFHSDSSGTYNGFNISYFSKQAFSTNNHNDSSDSGFGWRLYVDIGCGILLLVCLLLCAIICHKRLRLRSHPEINSYVRYTAYPATGNSQQQPKDNSAVETLKQSTSINRAEDDSPRYTNLKF